MCTIPRPITIRWTDVRLTILGKYGPYPTAGGCCSAYLVQEGDTALALDFGCGAYARLMEFLPLKALSFVALSHLHSDHCGDVPLLGYALQQGQGQKPLAIAAPKGYDILTAEAFRLFPLHEDFSLSLGGLTIQAFPVRHVGECYAFRVTNAAGRSLFYTGDSAYFPELAAKAAGADVLLSNACYVEEPTQGKRLHMTAADAGRLAREAGVGRLLLTHIWGGGADEDKLVMQANFQRASVAKERRSLEI